MKSLLFHGIVSLRLLLSPYCFAGTLLFRAAESRLHPPTQTAPPSPCGQCGSAWSDTALTPLGKNRPILSEVKTNKIISRSRAPEHPVRYAWEKLLREHDKTKKIYSVDPYGEVYQFRDNVYGILKESLDGMGELWQFLIVGPEKAFLIDTGFGLGNLKGLCDEITGGMPLIVANTHSHFDHAYGNFQFDKVYCHEYEAPLLQAKMNPHIWDYLFDENGNGIWCEFDRSDLVKFREYEIVPCPDGYTFDLGEGYEIEMIFFPGHSHGHCGFLDKKNKIFFAGDDLCVATIGMNGGVAGMPYREYATVEAFRRELVKVIARKDEIDAVFPSHSVLDLTNLALDNMLETCDRILADPYNADYTDEVKFGDKTVKRYGMSVPMSTYLFYSPDKVFMDDIRKIEQGK